MKFKEENLDYSSYMKGSKVLQLTESDKAYDVYFPEYENYDWKLIPKLMGFKSEFRRVTSYALVVKDYDFVRLLTEIVPDGADYLFFLRGFTDTFIFEILPKLDSTIQYLRLNVTYREANNRKFESKLLIDKKCEFIAVLEFKEITKIN